jgi:putative transcriptional regulator
MPDPRFRETVIVMVKHDPSGAFGVVINRPVLRAPLTEVMKGLGVEAKGAEGEITVYGGGPVEPEAAFVLHSSDYADKATVKVTEEISITSSTEVLAAIGAGKGPARRILIFGYAGWGPKQLDGEMAHEGWVVAPADAALVFDESHSTKWRRAITRRGIDL